MLACDVHSLFKNYLFYLKFVELEFNFVQDMSWKANPPAILLFV